jgi:6,7-dimethyl-8-ribityllumazine synthase
MEDNNYLPYITETINYDVISNEIVDLLTEMGFTSELPVNCETMTETISSIIRNQMEKQGAKTTTFIP